MILHEAHQLATHAHVKMIFDLLSSDIIRIIVDYYGAPYRPLFSNTCRLWRQLSFKPSSAFGGCISSLRLTDVAYRGHLPILQWIHTLYAYRTIAQTHISCSKRSADDIMALAARGGHVNIVRLCHDEWGAFDVDRAMIHAAAGGHEHIVRLCHDDYGATDMNRAMLHAAHGGHEQIVRLCHDEYGVTDANMSMIEAAECGHEHIVRLCHDEYGADDMNRAMAFAAANGHEHVVALCKSWIAAT